MGREISPTPAKRKAQTYLTCICPGRVSFQVQCRWGRVPGSTMYGWLTPGN